MQEPGIPNYDGCVKARHTIEEYGDKGLWRCTTCHPLYEDLLARQALEKLEAIKEKMRRSIMAYELQTKGRIL